MEGIVQTNDKVSKKDLAIIVDGDATSIAVPVGGYAYIKNNTHGLADGLYKNVSSSEFPVSGGTADGSVFTAVSGGGLNALNSNFMKSYVYSQESNYSIIGYNSYSNKFYAPYDGYVLVQVWNADSTIDLWIWSNLLKIPIRYANMPAFAVFLRKGLSVWIGGSGSNRSAVFQAIK